MTNNDFDFIKEKFETCGVEASDMINEAAVLEKIHDKEPVKPVMTKKRKIFTISTVAAAVAVVTAASILAVSVLGNKPVFKFASPFKHTASLRNFSTRDEVEKAIKQASEFQKNSSNLLLNSTDNSFDKDYSYDEEAGAVNGGSGSSFENPFAGNVFGGFSGGSSFSNSLAASGYDTIADYNSTYVQEQGVDEADIAKTDGRYIYYLNEYTSEISVFSAEGKNSKVIDIIQDNSGDSYFTEFFVTGNKLVVLASDYSGFDEFTEVIVYDVSNIKNIRKTGSFSQSGGYVSSRMINNMLYVVSNEFNYNGDSIPEIKQNGSTPDEIAPDCIFAPENPSDTSFLVVSAVNTEDMKQKTNSKAILGSADVIYCSTDYIFATAYSYSPVFYEAALRNSVDDMYSALGSVYYAKPETTDIYKIDLNGNLDFTAAGSVEGVVQSQYNMKENEGELRVATTSSNNQGEDINNLFILDENLKELGKVTGFAKGESIKAVRYVGDTAYVITYEQTDPLFVIDTSNSKNPKILGEVKISGFSTLLIPVDGNTILGIGYNTSDKDIEEIGMEVTDGIKLALFDVSDKKNPRVIDTKVYANCESPVQYDPRALLINFGRNDFTIPFSEYTNELYSHGIINFKVENGKIVETDKYISDKFSDNYDNSNNYVSSELERCLYADNTIYLLGSCYDNETISIIDSVDYK